MLINWHDSYSVGNKKIDEQHKELFELAKKAYLMGTKHTSREEIRDILGSFFEYMKVHFRDEEKYMEYVNYPDLEEHKKLHKQIIKELANTIVKIKNVNEMKEKLGVISQEWLLEHILHQDMLVAKYYKAKNAPDSESKSAPSSARTTEDKGATKKKEGYHYKCGCKARTHIIDKKTHEKMQAGSSYKCKICGEIIVYTGHFYFDEER